MAAQDSDGSPRLLGCQLRKKNPQLAAQDSWAANCGKIEAANCGKIEAANCGKRNWQPKKNFKKINKSSRKPAEKVNRKEFQKISKTSRKGSGRPPPGYGARRLRRRHVSLRAASIRKRSEAKLLRGDARRRATWALATQLSSAREPMAHQKCSRCFGACRYRRGAPLVRC